MQSSRKSGAAAVAFFDSMAKIPCGNCLALGIQAAISRGDMTPPQTTEEEVMLQIETDGWESLEDDCRRED